MNDLYVHMLYGVLNKNEWMETGHPMLVKSASNEFIHVRILIGGVNVFSHQYETSPENPTMRKDDTKPGFYFA